MPWISKKGLIENQGKEAILLGDDGIAGKIVYLHNGVHGDIFYIQGEEVREIPNNRKIKIGDTVYRIKLKKGRK